MAVGGSYGYTTGTTGARYRTYKAPAPPAAAAPFAQPPIPPSFYNPQYDVEEAEGKRGGEQERNKLARNQGYSNTDYAIGLGRVSENRTKALRQLGESFRRLGARQGEALSAAGELSGGAALASAQVRAANEGTQRGDLETGFRNQEGQLALGHQRQEEGYGEAFSNNAANERGFLEGLGKFKAKEASDRGYEAPEAPTAPRKGAGKYVMKFINGKRQRVYQAF